MGKKSQIITMRYQESHDKIMSKYFLRAIAKKPVYFTPHKVDKYLLIYGAENLGKVVRKYFEILDVSFLFVGI